MYLTEKWDGTTVQATNQGVFKRFDKIKKGDSRKHNASEAERYDIKELDLDDKSNKHIAKALKNYVEVFKTLPDGYCVYFEALGPNIGGRFKHIPSFHEIRVFDFSLKGEYLPFEEAITLAEQYELPLTSYKSTTLNISNILDLLDNPTCYDDVDAQLEGYVVREVGYDLPNGGAIAKIRVDDLEKVSNDV